MEEYQLKRRSSLQQHEDGSIKPGGPGHLDAFFKEQRVSRIAPEVMHEFAIKCQAEGAANGTCVCCTRC